MGHRVDRHQPVGDVTLVGLKTFYRVNWSSQGYEPGEVEVIDPMTGMDEFAQMGAATGGSFQAPPAGDAAAARNPNDPSTWGKVGRNDPCPCGSGKKYKHCHGQYV